MSLSRELKSLKDINKSGIHDIAPCIEHKNETRCQENKKLKRNNGNILIIEWSKSHSITISDVNSVIHFQNQKITNNIKNREFIIKKMMSQLNNNNDINLHNCTEIPEKYFHVNLEEISNGYYKGHLEDKLSMNMDEFLPFIFSIKKSASNKGIVFINTKEDQCNTHFDRDSAILILMKGKKKIKIACPINTSKTLQRPEDGIYENIDPFSSNQEMWGQWDWKTIDLSSGEALFIPKNWLHCIKSTAKTVAFSFQVELRNNYSIINNTSRNKYIRRSIRLQNKKDSFHIK